ncbi:hypothetical protein G6F68_017777 [Rhizopus microsporus]|nr:hypothetical protein G6F68_017777 [Rhizopus microsporus]
MHLLQLDSKEKLERVVKYHAVRDLYYENSTEEGEHQAETLINTQITLNKTQDGMFIRGSGAADGADRAVIGKVVKSDILSATVTCYRQKEPAIYWLSWNAAT